MGVWALILPFIVGYIYILSDIYKEATFLLLNHLKFLMSLDITNIPEIFISYYNNHGVILSDVEGGGGQWNT